MTHIEPELVPDVWRKALREVIAPIAKSDYAAAKQLHQELLQCIAALRGQDEHEHALAMQTQLSKSQWQLAAAEKKLQSHRRAGNVEGAELSLQLEVSQGVINGQKAEMREMKLEYDRMLAEQLEIQKMLKWKITLLDGGLATAEFEREERTRQLQQQAVRRMQNAGLARGFEAWRSLYEEEMQMRLVAKRMLNAGMAKCWGTWLDMAEEQTRKRRMLAAAVGKLTRPMLAACYAHWYKDWEAAIRLAEQGGLLGRIAMLEEALRQAREETVVKVREAETTANQERMEEMAMRAVRRMMNSQVTHCWETWVDECVKQVFARRRMTAFIGRLLNQHLARGWQAWLARWEEHTTCHTKLLSFLGRLLNQQLADGWDIWVSLCEQRIHRARLMHAAAKRLPNQHLGRGWRAWLAQIEEKRRNWTVINSCNGKLVNREMGRGFRAWNERWVERAQQMRVLAAAAGRLHNPELIASFRYWRKDWTNAHYASVAKNKSEAEVLRDELVASQEAAESTIARHNQELGAAAREVRKAAEHLALRERELAELKREMLRKQAEADRRIREERERANLKVAECEARLKSVDAPLSVEEKRSLLAAMNVRMEEYYHQSTAHVSPRTKPLRDALLQLAISSAPPPSSTAIDPWKKHVIVSDDIKEVHRLLRAKTVDGTFPNLSPRSAKRGRASIGGPREWVERARSHLAAKE